MKKKAAIFTIASTITAISTSTTIAATTPYDLIRPTWPVSWDSTAFDKFDTTGSMLINPLNFPWTPASFKAGEIIPDTLDQAYLDAINSKISPIRVNQVGYLKSDKERLFYFIGDKAEEFEVVDAYGKSLSKKTTGTFTASENETQSSWTIIAGTDFRTGASMRYKVDFTGSSGKIFIGNIPQSVPTGTRLRIKVGNEISSTFIVSDDVYTMAKDASLKFFGIQRSGNSESWFHGPSHLKDGAGKVVNGDKEVTNVTVKAGDLQGGWYDCGDHLKESQTQAFSFMALAVMSATNPSKDVDHYAYNQGEFVKTDGIPDVLREAKHGADFFLRAYRVANGVIDNMPVSVGNMSNDHGYWGRPEAQDNIAISRRGGAAERDVRLGELGSNVSAEIAAGLAILGKNYAKYDSAFADSCLMVAKKMYEFAKNLELKTWNRGGPGTYDGGKPYVHNIQAEGWATSNYSGNNSSHDDLSVAAIALHYATYETTKKMDYLNDAVKDTSIHMPRVVLNFPGGWMSWDRDGMRKIAVNTDWGSTHIYALYAFYKLLLKDSTTSSKYGISATERLEHIENVIDLLTFNISELSYPIGKEDFRLPPDNRIFTTEPTWFTMLSSTQRYFNYAQIGNVFDVLAYADVAKDIVKQGETLPNITTASLMSEEIFQIGINKLNYLFGMNPWEVSLVYGVGDKNDAHPHHRAANPEGRLSPGLDYKYRCPTGAILGGVRQGEENEWNPEPSMSWEQHDISETCLYGSALLMSALTIASNGGSDYYEKKCDNCNDGKAPITGSVYPLVYRYKWLLDIDAFSIRIENATLEDLDSVTAYVYFEATKEDIDSCKIIFILDICEKLNIAGFHEPCDAKDKIRDSVRNNPPYIIEDTFDKDKKTYTWAQEIPIDSLEYGTQIRLDLTATSGMQIGGKCETLNKPAKAQIDGWSFAPHNETKDAPAYDGAPIWNKSQGDIQNAPKDPYVVIRNKEGDLLWGYGPGKTINDRVGIVQVSQKPNAQMLLNRGTLFVQTAAQGTKTLKVFDVLGNQLLTQNFNGSQSQVNLANFSRRGTLVVKLVTGNRLLSTRTIRIK